MNLVDAYVTEIVGKPIKSYTKWKVRVEANCYGARFLTDVYFDTEEEALQMTIGHKILA